MPEPNARPHWYLKIPPPIWTLAMLAVAYVSRAFSPWVAEIYARSVPLAILFGGAGLFLAVWAILIFAAEGTEIEPASEHNKTLVTRGPFRFTRNPMYSGLILATLGVAFYFGTLPFFAVPVLLFLLVNFVFVPFEETKMLRQFGAQYTEYYARVRRWI